MEKLRCIITYLNAAVKAPLTHTVTYSLYTCPTFPDWSQSANIARRAIRDMCMVDSTSFIEDTHASYVRCDFVNAYIGGGVLGDVRFTYILRGYI